MAEKISEAATTYLKSMLGQDATFVMDSWRL